MYFDKSQTIMQNNIMSWTNCNRDTASKIMIDFLLNKANNEQIEEFFGYAPHGSSREDIEDNLSQMPDDVFDELVNEFGLPMDGVKL